MPLLTTHDSDTETVRRAFAHYPSGVAALAASVDGVDHVLVASSFTVGVSLEPALVMLAVQKTSQTWPHLARSARVGVSVLSAEQGSLCRQLAGRDREARWTGVETVQGQGGALLLEGASAALECTVYGAHEAGDHTIVVLQVHSMLTDIDLEPLVFHGSRFRLLV